MKTEIASLEIIGSLAIFLLQRTGSVYGTFTGRLSASEQREAFSCVPFGKCKFCINGTDETVSVFRKVCFGSDFESTQLSWLEMEKECRANKHPFTLGRYSRKYASLPL